MASITLNSVTFVQTPGGSQTATIKHRLTSDADVSGSYTTDTTSQTILADGTLSPAYTINGLNNSTSYTVWITSSCASYKEAFTTPAPLCSNITDITGSVSA